MKIPEALEQIEKGFLKKGILRVNQYNRTEGYVTIEGYEYDVFIEGRDQNRALDGDVIAIEILPQDQWVALKKTRGYPRFPFQKVRRVF